jgi:hypothetical protein
MFSKVKGELAAAVAVGAGLLLAAGYCITWAGLWNEDLPTSVILAALPQSIYLGAALSALVIPLVVLVTFGTSLLVLGFQDRVPLWWEWLLIGLGLAVYSKIVVTVSDLRLSGLWSWDVVMWSLVAAVAIGLMTLGLGVLSRLSVRDDFDRLDRVQLVGAVLLVAAIFAASVFKIVDAGFAHRVLPQVVAFLQTEDCPTVDDVARAGLDVPNDPADEPDEPGTQGGNRAPTAEPPRCSVAGFYVGENDQWIFLARPKDTRGPKAKRDPSRLFFVPRDSVVFAGAATTPLDPSPSGS